MSRSNASSPATPPGAAEWTAAQAALWERLRDYDFGGREAMGVFVARVAHACRCAREQALAAIDEYRRFCFLAVHAGLAVTPSRIIDHVWHAHMTDTREYWDRFCTNVLQRPLHHTPSRGGLAEAERHRQQYVQTLVSYQKHFGVPPAAFWPWVAIDEEAMAKRLNPARMWRAPSSSSKAMLATGAFALALWALLSLWEGVGNPLQWRGGSFLMGYVAWIVAACALAGRLHRALRGPGETDGEPRLRELAFLADGADRAADVDVIDAMCRADIEVDFDRQALRASRLLDRVWLRVRGQAPVGAHDRVLQAIRRHERLSKVLKDVRDFQEELHPMLIRKGLMLDAGDALAVRLFSALPLLVLLGLGVLKLGIGMARDRPVGLLTILAVIVALIALGYPFTPVRRTRAGDAALHRAATVVPADETPTETTMRLLALMGTVALIDTPFADYHLVREPMPNGGDGSGGGDSGSGGGDGSGGGGGCGGCGGGGCGG